MSKLPFRFEDSSGVVGHALIVQGVDTALHAVERGTPQIRVVSPDPALSRWLFEKAKTAQIQIKFDLIDKGKRLRYELKGWVGTVNPDSTFCDLNIDWVGTIKDGI
jgi:hypothetical protein